METNSSKSKTGKSKASTKPNDEFGRINAIERILGKTSKRVVLGIGDDTAIIQPPRDFLLLSTDLMIEGIHFDFEYASPYDVGFKALAAAVSDIAAMGGEPLYALFSLAIPKNFQDLPKIYEGVRDLATRLNIDIVGGDLSASKSGLFIDVTAVGQAANPIARSGARVGDWVAVSGNPGASAAGLHALKNMMREDIPPTLIKAHLNPIPRIDLRDQLTDCTSLIDISDGIASELHHLANKSEVGFKIETERIPLHSDAIKVAAQLKQNALHWALSGGEDYQLLATFDANKFKNAGELPNGFTAIGLVVEKEKGLRMKQASGEWTQIPREGYNHFAE